MGKNKKERRPTPLTILTKNNFLYNGNSSPFTRPDIPMIGENLCTLDFFLQSLQSGPTFHNMMENPMINNWNSTSPSSLSAPFVPPQSLPVNSAPSFLASPPIQTNGPLPLLSISPNFINPIKIGNEQATTEILNKISKQKIESNTAQSSSRRVVQDNESKTQLKLSTKTQAILDNLSTWETKCEDLYQELKTLMSDYDIITKSENASIFVNEFFRKIMHEPVLTKFLASLLLELCNNMSPNNTKNSLHSEILNECQKLFESSMNTPSQFNSRRKRQFERREQKIRFIGELYNVNLLATEILQRWIIAVLDDNSNPKFKDQGTRTEIYAFICVLLLTAGQKLESELKTEVQPDMEMQNVTSEVGLMDKLFNRLSEFENFSKVEENYLYVLNLIEDVIALRKNGWKPILQSHSVPANPNDLVKEVIEQTLSEISTLSIKSSDFTEETEKTEESTSEDIQGDIVYRRFRPNKSLLQQQQRNE